ncbi:FtsX-like permease family protein [Candidatus Poribacteria bacterium]|nr:FtsX-like permease family protein [Candidatus Poribacteria bacterium]
MIFLHSFAQGFAAMGRHKLRALLTMLGMVIGIATVTGMVSVSEGYTKVVIDLLERIGFGNMIVVFRPDWVQLDDGRWVPNRAKAFLRYSDAQAIGATAPSVKLVLPELSGFMAPIRYSGREKQVTIAATTPEYEEGHNWYLDRGRFVTDTDVEREELVCAIGTDIEKELFPGEDPIGKYVRMWGQRFLIVGVMSKKGDFTPDFTGTNNTLVLPLTTFQRRYMGSDRVGVFFVRATSTQEVEQALLETKVVLARTHGVDPDEAFQFFTSDEIMRQVNRVSFILKAFLVGVASIALVVGGVGIMNMMLVTVTERTREIGLRKAVGAHRRHILYQFLIEAIVMGAVGGIIGIVVGATFGKAVGLIMSQLVKNVGGPPVNWPAVVSLETGLVAMAISGAIGILAGIFPAFRAALLPPTEALRHE